MTDRTISSMFGHGRIRRFLRTPASIVPFPTAVQALSPRASAPPRRDQRGWRCRRASDPILCAGPITPGARQARRKRRPRARAAARDRDAEPGLAGAVGAPRRPWTPGPAAPSRSPRRRCSTPSVRTARRGAGPRDDRPPHQLRRPRTCGNDELSCGHREQAVRSHDSDGEQREKHDGTGGSDRPERASRGPQPGHDRAPWYG
jgi:hypothetical protein